MIVCQIINKPVCPKNSASMQGCLCVLGTCALLSLCYYGTSTLRGNKKAAYLRQTGVETTSYIRHLT